MTTVLETFVERGFVQQITDEPGLQTLLAAQSISFYCGFDPTADSLHVGSLVPIMALIHMQRAGHRPIVLLGGATGMIGDPSGKDKERELLTTDRLAQHTAGIRAQLERFLDFDDPRTGAILAFWSNPSASV